MLGFKLALVGSRLSSTPRCAASVCRSARCAGVLGVPEACRLGAPLVVGAVEVAAPLLTAFSTPLPKLLATLVASGFPGKTRGTPLLDCPREDVPGAPHRPVLPGWSPLFAGSPCPIPHRGAPASLTTALARGGKWSLHA